MSPLPLLFECKSRGDTDEKKSKVYSPYECLSYDIL